MKHILITLTLLFSLMGCGSGSGSSLFNDPNLVAVDSTNNRVFIFEKGGNLFIFTASTFEEIGEDQPVVNDERNTTIHSLLPVTATGMVVINIGSTSRLFLIGVQTNGSGDNVSNQILVLDFDGTTISQASFSPLTVGDATTDSGNRMGGLVIDSANSILYATDSTGEMLHIYNATDGSENSGPLAITGIPNKMSLDSNRLYVANNTATEDDQVITVVNTDDLSRTTIDLNAPTDGISVLSNDTGTVMLAKESGEPVVRVLIVNTDTFDAATAIPAGDSSVDTGEINSGKGISSAVGSILLTRNSSGTIFGYVPQADGNLELLTILSDLSSFTGQTLSTVAEIFDGIDVFVDSSGVGDTVYIAAGGSGDVLFTDVGSTEVNGRF